MFFQKTQNGKICFSLKMMKYLKRFKFLLLLMVFLIYKIPFSFRDKQNQYGKTKISLSSFINLQAKKCQPTYKALYQTLE